MEVKTHQGCSKYTLQKEFEIKGLTKMRATQFKSEWFRFKKVLFADVFCGTGRNFVDGQIVDGSPIRIIDGFIESKNTKFKPIFWFSDIRKDACDTLEKIIKDRYDMELPVKQMAASDAVNEIGNFLVHNPDTYLCLTLDPNGPKDFPKNETQDLISGISRRIDVNPYISVGAMNRQLQARNKAHYQLTSWLAGIENFDEGFVKHLTAYGRKGWIRRPLEGDAWRWTMIPNFGWGAPKSNWEKQGFVGLETPEAKEVIKFYCGSLYNDK